MDYHYFTYVGWIIIQDTINFTDYLGWEYLIIIYLLNTTEKLKSDQMS